MDDRKGMSYTEEDWIEENGTAHRELYVNSSICLGQAASLISNYESRCMINHEFANGNFSICNIICGAQRVTVIRQHGPWTFCWHDPTGSRRL